MLKTIKLELEEIISEIDNSWGIGESERKMLLMDLPKKWNINQQGNMEIEMETEFEKFLLAISEHTNEDINNITVFRFYALIGFIKEKNVKK